MLNILIPDRSDCRELRPDVPRYCLLDMPYDRLNLLS